MTRKRGESGIFSLRLRPYQYAALEQWARRQPVPPTIPEICRVAVEEWMNKHGLLRGLKKESGK